MEGTMAKRSREAVVIDFAVARARFADRVAAREARNADEVRRLAMERVGAARVDCVTPIAMGPREQWLADLETWPLPFQRALRSYVQRCTEPRNLAYSGRDCSRSAHGYWEKCRNAGPRKPGGPFEDGFAYRLSRNASTLHGAARALRQARAMGQRSRIERRQRELKEARKSLLRTLWMYGLRRIVRAELEPVLREDLARERDRRERSIWYCGKELRQLEDRLRIGVYLKGKKKGQPLEADYREAMNKGIGRLHQLIAERERGLSRLDAEPDVLRAWGLYSGRRR
jgi:hypothetical protein